MAYDPCDLIPDSTFPAGKPLHPRPHAIHHVIGRIRHRVPRRGMQHGHGLHHAAKSHAQTPVEGCEAHAAPSVPRGRGVDGGALLRTVSASPALAAISGAGGAAIGGLGGYVTGRATREHKPHTMHPGGGTPIPEPSSAMVLVPALLIGLALRHVIGHGSWPIRAWRQRLPGA